jgi:hypothetical protein
MSSSINSFLLEPSEASKLQIDPNNLSTDQVLVVVMDQDGIDDESFGHIQLDNHLVSTHP